MELKTKIVKKGEYTYEYDVIQQLEYNTPVIVTIGNVKKDKFGKELHKALLGQTFIAERTGSHSVQPIVPFGDMFYNIYAHNLSSLISLREEPIEYLKAEKALMPLRSRGDLYWYKRGKLHRDDDLPAKILKSGSMYWYRHGKIQRTGFKPAVVNAQGNHWYKDGFPADKEHLAFILDKAPEYFI